MSTVEKQAPKANVPAIAPTRLPYHPGLQERFGVDSTTWRALVEASFPNAKTTEAVILALAYCKARGLDPMKRCVHIVPIWDSKSGREIETVWPGIAEHRTTAFRTGKYAGKDRTEFGPTIEQTFFDKDGKEVATIKFPEWAEVTVYRLAANGERVAFHGPRVYWLESFSHKKQAPNDMWRKRPFGQLDKCSEAAALRAAFPEELGGELTADEAEGIGMWHGRPALLGQGQPHAVLESPQSSQSQRLADTLAHRQEQSTEHEAEATPEANQEPQDTDGDDMLLTEYGDQLAKCETVTDIVALEKHAAENPGLCGRGKQLVEEACLKRKDGIREKRGEKSNTKGTP